MTLIGIPYLAHGPVYHHDETMCCVHSWFQYDLHLWPQGQLLFDIFISYLAHGSITMRRYITYIHDLDTTLTFDLKVKIYRVLDMASHWGHIGVTVFFVFLHGHTIFGTCVNIMEWYTYHIHLRPSHVTFTLDFWVKTDFCLMHECVCLSLQEIIIASCNCSCLPFYFSF